MVTKPHDPGMEVRASQNVFAVLSLVRVHHPTTGNMIGKAGRIVDEWAVLPINTKEQQPPSLEVCGFGIHQVYCTIPQ